MYFNGALRIAFYFINRKRKLNRKKYTYCRSLKGYEYKKKMFLCTLKTKINHNIHMLMSKWILFK